MDHLALRALDRLRVVEWQAPATERGVPDRQPEAIRPHAAKLGQRPVDARLGIATSRLLVKSCRQHVESDGKT